MQEAKLETRTTETGPLEARRIDWHAVLDTALNSPGQLGATYNRFHNYSFLNQIMLLSQGARGPVASYKRWQALGRQVQRGERGYEIIRPIQVKAKEETPEGEDEKHFTRFKLVRGAFTYSQTSGEELQEPEVPTWDYKRALGKLAITEVPFDDINGNIAGYAYERNIAVSPVAVYPVKTRLHEMAHVVLGHTEGDKNYPGYEDDRGFREFEAESTAYLSLNELSQTEMFDAAESRGYIQGWLSGREVTTQSIRNVFKATQAILDAGYPEREGRDVT